MEKEINISENKKEFISWINETFAEYKFTNKTSTDGKKMFKFQLFIRDYLQNTSPFRGLLIYHGLGTGKTATSIITAEGLSKNMNINVLLPASLENEYINEIKTWGDNSFNINRNVWKFIELSDLLKKV